MLGDMSDTDLARNTVFIQKNIDAIEESLGELEETYRRAAVNGKKNLADYWSELIEQERKNLDRARADLAAALEESGERRADWIKSMFSGTQAGKIQKINEQLALARKYLTDPGLGGEERAGLQEIIQDLTADLKKLTETAGGSMSEIDRMAARWKETWAGVWGQFQAEQSMDPFAGVELERGKKLADAHNNYVREANKETIDQINAYYDAKRTGIINSLKEKEERMLWELTETRVDDLAWEMQEELKNIGALESQRVIAAAGSEEEIRLIHERAAAMRAEVERRYGKETADALAEDARRAAEAASDPMKSRLEEVRTGLADWQQSLADSFSLALMNIEGFSSKAAVILGDLGAQFVALFPPAALSGLEEFGRALGEGEEASTAMTRALAEMAQQILRQLPMLFLQAGLQLIANGQWLLGPGLHRRRWFRRDYLRLCRRGHKHSKRRGKRKREGRRLRPVRQSCQGICRRRSLHQPDRVPANLFPLRRWL
jgi:hypothetical protein